jgi:uncharacterized PurR-regulated membrane protein YhhQ (DUF165 family)
MPRKTKSDKENGQKLVEQPLDYLKNNTNKENELFKQEFWKDTMKTNLLHQYKYSLSYVLSIVLVNIGFVYIPPVPLLGEMFPPMSLLVGFIFVLRDFAQKEIGHKVLAAMAVGAVLSYFMADPFVAIASVVAFLISELCDWGVYTYTKRPLKDRILLSSAVGTPIDSAVFLLILGFFSPLGFVLMTIAKMIAAGFIWLRLKNEN